MLKKLILLASLLVLLYFNECRAEYRVVCYYPSWGRYRAAPDTFTPLQVPYSSCTHLVFAFGKVEGTLQTLDSPNDEGAYAELVAGRDLFNPALRILLSVGGHSVGSAPFTAVVRTTLARQQFVMSAVSYLRRHKLDGLDLDWEFPTRDGSPPEDRERLAQLVQDLWNAFDNEARSSGKPRLLLTVALGAAQDVVNNAYDIPTLASAVDFMNVMGYDFHGSWNNYTGLHSALYSRPGESDFQATLNQNWLVQHYLRQGAPADKLVLGVPTYARTWKFAAEETKTDVGDPASGGGGYPRSVTATAGVMAYFEICEEVTQGKWVAVLDPVQQATFAFSASEWASYDDPASIKLKMEYVIDQGLGGAMLWDISFDDFNNKCDGGSYPLLQQVNKSLRPEAIAGTVLASSPTQKSPSGPQLSSSNPSSNLITSGAKSSKRTSAFTTAGSESNEDETSSEVDVKSSTSNGEQGTEVTATRRYDYSGRSDQAKNATYRGPRVPFYRDQWGVLILFQLAVVVIISIIVTVIMPKFSNYKH